MLWRQKAVEHMFHYSGTGFHVVPKFHLFQHMPLHITRAGVPRTYWVYSDETKNRQVKGLWTKVSKGWSMHEQIFLRLMWLEALENLWRTCGLMLKGCPFSFEGPFEGALSFFEGICLRTLTLFEGLFEGTLILFRRLFLRTPILLRGHFCLRTPILVWRLFFVQGFFKRPLTLLP